MRAGLIVVNTNPLYTEREMEHQFNDSGAKALVVLANMASKPKSAAKHRHQARYRDRSGRHAQHG